MSKRIIAAVDGREPSRDAVRLAGELASGTGAGLDVAAVIDYNPLPIGVEPYEVALRNHFAEIFRLVDEAEPGLEYTPHHLGGSSPPRALSELAESLGAGLIVLGSTDRGPLGRVLPGSVGDRLLSGGPCPIAVAPRGHGGAAHRIERIGIGFDGRPESEVALGFAAGLAHALGAKLRLIAVVAPPTSTLEEIASPFGYEQALRERFDSALRRGAGSVDGIEVETALLDGDPAAVLAEQSSELDLLALGSRGYGPVRRALLGDVASALTRTAGSPIIVVPRGWETPDAGAGRT